jgi:hypothetical protein
MTDLSLNLIIQISLEIALDPNLITRYSNLNNNDLELDEIVDDIMISLYHLL